MSSQAEPNEGDTASGTPDLDADDDLLSIAGGWILFSLGLVLIALAFVFRATAAVASPSLVLGVSCVVLAVVLSRAEGALEVGPGGLKVSIRQLRRSAKRDKALTEGQKSDVVALASERLTELPRAITSGQARAYAANLYAETRNDVIAFELRVRAWLVEQGWSVQTEGVERGVDYVATTADGATLLVEAKLTTRPLTRGLFLTWLPPLLRAHTSFPKARIALFVSTPDVTTKGLEAVRGAPIEVYVERQNEFERVDA